jgi:ankyrin repeat protein
MSFENRIPSLAGLGLLKALKHFSPEEIENTLRQRNVGNPQEVIASALLQFCASRAAPDYLQRQKPLSDREKQRILEQFTHLEQPYGGAILRIYLVQLKKDLRNSLSDTEKKDKIRKYVNEMLVTSLLTERTSTFFYIFHTFNGAFNDDSLSMSPYLKIACGTANKEVLEFGLERLYPSREYNSWDQKKLTDDQEEHLKSIKSALLKYCFKAIREGTLCDLFPIFETKLPIIFKNQIVLEKLLDYAAKEGDKDSVKLLVEKGATSKVAVKHAYKFGFENIANYLIKNGFKKHKPSSVETKTFQKSESLSLDRFVISGVADLKQLNDFLQSHIQSKKLPFEEREQILRMFFSSEEWQQLTPLNKREQQRVLAILDHRKGNISYRNKCIDRFVKNALRTAVGSSSEGFRLLFILLVSEKGWSREFFLNNIALQACHLEQKEKVSTYLDICIPKEEVTPDSHLFIQEEKMRTDFHICGHVSFSTLLSAAINHDDVDMVKLLVANVPMYKYLEAVSNDTVYKAIKRGNKEIIKCLLQEVSKKKPVLYTGRLIEAPLSYDFLKKNSSIHVYLRWQKITLIDQCASTIRRGKTDLTKRYFEKIKDAKIGTNNINGRAVNKINYFYESTKKGSFLHLVAIKHGHIELLRALIDQHKVDPNKGHLEKKRSTSLILAARQKNPKILPYLISILNKETITKDIKKALFAAVKYRQASNISCLLKNGAKVDRGLVNRAIYNGDFQIFRHILADMGSALTEKYYGETLLHMSILLAKEQNIHRLASILAYLLVQKAVKEAGLIYAENANGKTPLQLALNNVDNKIPVELLLKVDATLKPENYVHDPKARETATALIDLFEAENAQKKLDELKKPDAVDQKAV